MTVCLFLPSGKTFTFRGARIVTDNETVLVIEYVAMSDGRGKTLTAQKAAIVGWSISDEPLTGAEIEARLR